MAVRKIESKEAYVGPARINCRPCNRMFARGTSLNLVTASEVRP
jgi:hypothetical protein